MYWFLLRIFVPAYLIFASYSYFQKPIYFIVAAYLARVFQVYRWHGYFGDRI